MTRTPWIVAGLATGVAITLALLLARGGGEEAATHAAFNDQLATLTARTAALEATVERLATRRTESPVGSARPARPSPETAPSRPSASANPSRPMPHVRDGSDPLDSGEAFRRVGARDDYADALELVEQVPELTRRWVRVTSLTYKLDASATDSLLKAATKVASELQPVGRDYLAGRIDRATLRKRFWKAYGGIGEKLSATWSAPQLERFGKEQSTALSHFEWLPALVGDRPR